MPYLKAVLRSYVEAHEEVAALPVNKPGHGGEITYKRHRLGECLIQQTYHGNTY